MKSIISFCFLFVTLSNALRITKLDPTHVSKVINHHHHHHVDHDLRGERLSHSADASEIIFPTVSTKEGATEDNNLHSLTKIANDHLQNQLQVHLINRFNKYSLPGHTYNPHKCRHHLRFIAYYPRFIDREAHFSRNLLKGQADHELQMLDQIIRPHYFISHHRLHHHHNHHDHRDVKDDQTVEEKTELEDQHEESEKKDKEHEHETREKDLLIKIRKFLPYF